MEDALESADCGPRVAHLQLELLDEVFHADVRVHSEAHRLLCLQHYP